MADRTKIKKILYITLSNLGDAVMALPAFDYLKRACPGALITVVAAPRTRCLFENNSGVNRLLVFDKSASWREKKALFLLLKKERFDVVIDLKNTFYRWAIPARIKNPAWIHFPAWARHASAQHLLKAVVAIEGRRINASAFEAIYSHRGDSLVSLSDSKGLDEIFAARKIDKARAFVLIVPGARSALKKWTQEGYAEVIRSIRATYGLDVIIAGDKDEKEYCRRIIELSGENVFDLSGETTLAQLCSLILRARLIVCNDSGVLQIASYFNKPLVGIYGPTDYHRYGPWSQQGVLVRKHVLCAPCAQAQCRFNNKTPECIATIRPYDVLLAVRLILEDAVDRPKPERYRRILIVRTDRIGDVVLTSPVIKSLRDHYPSSYIAMMVSSYTRECVEGNPYLDRVIVFDKDKYNGLAATLRFADFLKKEKFDVVIIFYPTARLHFLMFLAGIRERIGYDWRAPFFLTKAVHHLKQEGTRHEIEYNFDLLKPLGIETVSWELYMPIKETSEKRVESVLKEVGLSSHDRIVILNPSAGCISRLWPPERYAQVADGLSKHGFKVVVTASEIHKEIVGNVLKHATTKPVDLSGRFSISELASLFKKSRLLISNDSGPVHIAAAVKTPVIAIFGRNQPGLGPKRWGPVGSQNAVFFKKTDCVPCLAHDCFKNFKCLKAISVDEVVDAALRILEGRA